ncbi:MAG: hypothetical protein K8R36_20805, partial [Planctomycetales bacterium]|nr:hypothetical protein [Planctomycetales bacterium]
MAVSTPPQPAKPNKAPVPEGLPEFSGPDSGAGKWMALAAALLGWLFDGAEMGIFSMVGRPAVQDLLSEQLKDLTP